MSAKYLIAGVLLTTLLGVHSLLAEVPPFGYSPTSPVAPLASGPSMIPSPSAALVNPATLPQPVSPSAAEWLNNSPCNCCGPTGKNGPIGSELFVMTGPTIPVGPSILTRFANTGWMVEGGVRSLFFNPNGDAAWTAVVALSYQYNNGSGRVAPFNFFNNPRVPVTIRELERYGLTFGGGRDWFLYGQAQNCGRDTNLRVGVETGGRWGGERANLNLIVNNPIAGGTFLHRYKVYGGYYLGGHVNFEVPMGSWVWFGGFRAEWGINFGDVIPYQNNTIQDVNLLLSTGFRY